MRNDIPPALAGNPKDEVLWSNVVRDSIEWRAQLIGPGSHHSSPGPGIAPFDKEANTPNYDSPRQNSQAEPEQDSPYQRILGDNIVASWRSLVTKGSTQQLKPALDAMNSALNTSIRHSRIAEWAESIAGRKPSNAVYEFMMVEVLSILASDPPANMPYKELTKALRLP